MLSIELINLYSNISILTNYFIMSSIILANYFVILSVILHVISFVKLSAPIVSILFTLASLNKYKNLVLGILSLITNSYIIIDDILII